MYADIDKSRKVSLMELSATQTINLHKSLLSLRVNSPALFQAWQMEDIYMQLKDVVTKLAGNDF